MKLDPGIHIAMHSVLFLKPGVTSITYSDLPKAKLRRGRLVHKMHKFLMFLSPAIFNLK